MEKAEFLKANELLQTWHSAVKPCYGKNSPGRSSKVLVPLYLAGSQTGLSNFIFLSKLRFLLHLTNGHFQKGRAILEAGSTSWSCLLHVTDVLGDAKLSTDLSRQCLQGILAAEIPLGGWPPTEGLWEMIKRSILTENGTICGLSILLPIPDNCSFWKASSERSERGITCARKRLAAGLFYHKCCKLVLQGPSEKRPFNFLCCWHQDNNCGKSGRANPV